MANEAIREENIQRTIQAGIQCFIEDGIANTQLQYVAAKAGISRRSCLRYFGNKDHFVIAVLGHINARCHGDAVTYAKELMKNYPTALDRFRALFEKTAEYFLAHPELFILLAEGESYLIHSSEKETFLNQYVYFRDYWPNVVLSLMEQGAEDGSITCFSRDYIQENESNAVWYAYMGLLVQLAYSNALGNYTMESCSEIIRRFIDQTIKSLN